jgi:hypothetical protein
MFLKNNLICEKKPCVSLRAAKGGLRLSYASKKIRNTKCEVTLQIKVYLTT